MSGGTLDTNLSTRLFNYGTVTLFGMTFQKSSSKACFDPVGPQPRMTVVIRFGLFLFRSPLLEESLIYFLFLRLLRCFSSPGSLLVTYVFSYGRRKITPAGFPHSDIHGSMLAYSSPWLFAVGRVLLRFLVPRHPPCALRSLIYIHQNFPKLKSLNCFFTSVSQMLLPPLPLKGFASLFLLPAAPVPHLLRKCYDYLCIPYAVFNVRCPVVLTRGRLCYPIAG